MTPFNQLSTNQVPKTPFSDLTKEKKSQSSNTYAFRAGSDILPTLILSISWVAVLILSAGSIVAQEGFIEMDYPKFQSPETHSLGIFGEIPVSMYTGVPDITIPITTVNAGNYNLPVTLNYHPSNVKAVSKASWVGLGWSLSAGGVITRSVKGCADDELYGYYHQGYRLYDNDFWNTPLDLTKDVNVAIPGQNPNSVLEFTQTGKCINGNSLNFDFEPDEFYYNFGGRSGKFVLPPKPESGIPDIRTIPTSKLDIVPFFGSDLQLTRFEITDESGVRFVFSAIEELDNTYSLTANSGGTIVTDNISWYLTEIIPPTSSETITLSYHEPEAVSYFSRSIKGNHWYNEPEDSLYNEIDFFVNLNGAYHFVRRLSSIESGSIKVVFNSASAPDRYDSQKYYRSLWDGFSLAAQEYSLQSIDIKTIDDALLSSWEFDFGYFNNSVQNRLDGTPINAPDLWKRLRLDGIDIKNATSQDISHYRFEYNSANYEHLEYNPITNQMEGTGVYYSLPPFLDVTELGGTPSTPYEKVLAYPQYDYWGYFNGKVNSLYNIPFLDYTNTRMKSSRGPKSVDREPDEEAMKVGVLSKIIYPTGGYTTYEFETNTYDAVGSTQLSISQLGEGLRIKQIKSYDFPGTDPIVKTYMYEEADGSTSGAIISEPTFLKPYFGIYDLDYGSLFPEQEFYDNSTFELGNTKGGFVGYKRVTEQLGVNGEFGKVVYSFTNPEDYNNTLTMGFWATPETYRLWDFIDPGFGELYEDYYLDYMVYRNTRFTSNYSQYKWGFGQRTNLDARRGLLTQKEIYDESGSLKTKETYDYFESFDEDSPDSQYHQVLRGLSIYGLPKQTMFGTP
ncbi:MAG: hypothetical protein AAFW89_10445, partial [Bacteroidota bacterium]